MKQIYLTEQEKTDILEEFRQSLSEIVNGTVSFSKQLPCENKKIKICYSPEAYAKTIQLVMNYPTEVAWHCLVRRYDEGFYVYDVLMYPQKVSAATVTTDMNKYAKWKIDLTDEQDANLFGQCHSHVDMGTTASSTDIKQQKEELQLKGNTGFYMFQIWNKKLDVNTFLYDLDNNVCYEKNDVEIVVDFPNYCGYSTEFIADSRKMLITEAPKKESVQIHDIIPEPEWHTNYYDNESIPKKWTNAPYLNGAVPDYDEYYSKSWGYPYDF